jgi:hypothetical protein
MQFIKDNHWSFRWPTPICQQIFSAANCLVNVFSGDEI